MQKKAIIAVLGVTMAVILASLGLVFFVGPKLNADDNDGVVVFDDPSYFTLSGSGSCEIAGLSEKGLEKYNNATAVEIDMQRGGMMGFVYQINSNAFKDMSKITKVILAPNLTTICSGAFYGCTGLQEIEIPDKVTDIQGTAFTNCKSLTSIKLPAGFAKSGASGYAIFSGCSSLKSVDMSQCADISSFLHYTWFSSDSPIKNIIAPNATIAASYKRILTSYTNQITYPVECNVNYTNEKSQTLVYTEKVLANGSNTFNNWHYVDGKWQEVNNYQPSLPTLALPNGWYWQDSSNGQPLTTAKLQEYMLRAANNGSTVTVNVVAVRTKITSITGLKINDKVYDGTTTATLNNSAAVYTGLINGHDVYVELKPEASLQFANANVGENIPVTLTADMLMLSGADADGYEFASNVTIDNGFQASITPATMEVIAMGGTVRYNGAMQNVIRPISATLCDGATEDDKNSIQWEYSYTGNANTWQTNIPTAFNVGTYTVYYRVTANNHETVIGSVKFTIVGENDPIIDEDGNEALASDDNNGVPAGVIAGAAVGVTGAAAGGAAGILAVIMNKKKKK